MTKLDYAKEHIDGFILRKTETRDFLELVVDRYGDIVTYRVYGDSKNGFNLCVK